MRQYKHDYFHNLRKTNWAKFWIFLVAVLVFVPITLSLQKQEPEGLKFVAGRVYRLIAQSNEQWTDTGYDVEGEKTLSFSASGGISLQVGNPMAYCGPDGYDMKTIQQPIKDKNIGALIGKVVLLISIEVDEETGEETRNEMVEIFYIGSNRIVSMPISGRLFLGINEDVAGDNSGRFTVDIRLIDQDVQNIRSQT
jgi:hypothetical protein